MICGSRLYLTLLLSVITLGWLAGCGPKPVTFYMEPPEPNASIETAEPEAALETGKDNGLKSRQIANSYPDLWSSAPTTDSPRISGVEVPPLIHKVRWRHETLYTIALWYTGRGNNWRRLAAANPDIKPRSIRIGDTVRIPGSMLTRRRPMPADYLKPAAIRKPRPVQKKPSKSVEKVKSPPEREPADQAPALYGPIGEAPQAPVEEDNELPVPLETLDE